MLRELDSSGAHAAGMTGSLLRDLVDGFLASAPVAVADLRAAAERDDATAMQEVAHHLKGAAVTLGLAAMAALCAEVETLVSSGALMSARGLIPRLEEELDGARSALDAAVSSR
jgi:HPt (histidine-containing phosphotransfer) domain-containing protein